MKKLIVLFLTTIIFVASCQPSESDIQTAVSQTQEAQPAPTKIPFGEIDIQGILIQPGDLPLNYEIGQTSYDWPSDIGVPMKVTPDNFIMQKFSEKGDSLDFPHFSMLALYNDKNNAVNSYNEIVKEIGGNSLVPSIVGDVSTIAYSQISRAFDTKFTDTVLYFQRCNSVILIRAIEWTDEEVYAYAKGLDKRVEKIACQ